MKYTTYIFLLAATMTLAACDSAEPEEELPVDPTFTAVQAIFSTSCDNPGCHSGSSPEGSLDLTQGNSFGEIVNVNSEDFPAIKLVDPGNPGNSYLVTKIDNDGSRMGNNMPPGGSLSVSQIKTVKDWISEGAMNN